MTGVDQLSEEELRSFNAALEALRGAIGGSFFHTELRRNLSGVLSEVRAYANDSVSRLLLAEVSIRPDSKLGPVRLHHTEILDNRRKY